MVGIGGSIKLELLEITIEEVYVYDGPSVKEKINGIEDKFKFIFSFTLGPSYMC